MTYETDSVEIDGTIIATTPDAIMLDDGDVQVWIPTSQISNYCANGLWGIGDLVTVEIPEWLATDRGLT